MKTENEKLDLLEVALHLEKVSRELNFKVSWLVGADPGEDTWVFEKQKEAEADCKTVMHWKPIFDIDDHSKQVAWEVWKGFGKRFCVAYFDQKTLSASSKKNYAQNVKSVISFFSLDRCILSPNELSISDIDAYESFLKTKHLSKSLVSEYLRVVRLFFQYQPILGEGLIFDPYPEVTNSIQKAATRIGYANGHTKTLYPQDGLALLNHALRVIDDSECVLFKYEWLVEKRRSLEGLAGVKRATARNRLFKDFKNKFGEGLKEFNLSVEVVYASSIIILLSLSAMRKHEMAHLTFDDAKKLLDDGTDILTGRVYKTARTSSGKKTNRKSIKQVKDAVRVAISLSEPMRKKYGSKYLFLRLIHSDGFSNSGRKKYVELTETPLYRLLDKFSEDAGFTKGTLRPHMFRRFFALMWAWRFEIGDLEYLSDLLFHNGEEMTKVYVEDEALWEFISDELKQLTQEILKNALLGNKKIYGKFGRAIEKYKRLIRGSINVVGLRKAEVLTEKLISKGMIVVPAQDGFCIMSPSRAPRAACGDGFKPDYAKRSDETCSGCFNFGMVDNRKSYWLRRYKAHEKVYQNTHIIELKEASKKSMSIALEVINSF